MKGVLIIDKPMGVTSFDVIRDIRKEYGTKKVGHTGTLDPMATGVLPILIGDATKLSDYLMDHDKEYIAVLKLGEKRDTGDSEGNIIETSKIPNLTTQEIENTLKAFIGKISQIPPMYSAIKVNGKKLYELAREGKEIERKPRSVEIYSIELLEVEKNKENIIDKIKFKVNCSKGTYIRTLCEDIAEKLGTVGYMKELRRTRVGKFTLEDINKCVSLEEILSEENAYILKENEKSKLLNGVIIKTNLADGLVRIYKNNEFIGIGEVKNKNLKRKIIVK